MPALKSEKTYARIASVVKVAEMLIMPSNKENQAAEKVLDKLKLMGFICEKVPTSVANQKMYSIRYDKANQAANFILLKYSSGVDRGSRLEFFYSLNPDAEHLQAIRDRLFIIMVCGEEQIFTVPFAKMKSLLDNVKPNPDRSRRFHFYKDADGRFSIYPCIEDKYECEKFRDFDTLLDFLGCPPSERDDVASNGFSTDSDKKKEVERIAIESVTNLYKQHGWQVESVETVETEKKGYDLDCTHSSGVKNYLEVKGLSGNKLEFTITRREVEFANANNEFFLWVVTNALSQPELHRFSRDEFLEKFALEPTEYRATFRG